MRGRTPSIICSRPIRRPSSASTLTDLIEAAMTDLIETCTRVAHEGPDEVSDLQHGGLAAAKVTQTTMLVVGAGASFSSVASPSDGIDTR